MVDRYSRSVTTRDDIRKMIGKLPGAVEAKSERIVIEIEVKGKMKGLAWSWMERVDPKKARVLNLRVLAVAVPNLTTKDLLIDSDPLKFFTEPHYNGYPAVLVRLDVIDPPELEGLLIEAWRHKAPKSVVLEFDWSHP